MTLAASQIATGKDFGNSVVTGANLPYVYQVDATDPNGDPLSYHLGKFPAGMTIDPAMGVVSWTPASQLLGTTQAVTIRVDDGRGGSDNRRTSILIDSDGAGPQPAERTNIIYNGGNAWGDFGGDGTVKARYVFGNNIDQIITQFRPREGTSWYHTDRLRTVRESLGPSGVVAKSTSYAGFGKSIGEGNAVSFDRFMFTGRELIAYLPGYYYRARFY